MKIVADQHIPFLSHYFCQGEEIILRSGRDISAADVKTADMLLVRSITPVNAKLLENSAVKFVGTVTAGCDHIDTAWLNKRGIAWQNATGFNAIPVADYVIEVMAAVQKRKFITNLQGRAAVIGVGHVGRLVAERLSLLGFSVLLSDPPRAEQESNFTSLTLAEIEDCDLISLHVPLSKEGNYPTYHFIDEAFLRRQRPGCILLNASRGAVIDSTALLAAGKHMIWCFDVWENEPHIAKKILAESLIASPHIAGYSIQSKYRGIEMIYQAAKASGLFPTLSNVPLVMPRQTLSFQGKRCDWQEVILSVFDPFVMTAMMKSALEQAVNLGSCFDALRNGFDHGNEFGYTVLADIFLSREDEVLLRALGFQIAGKSAI